MKVQNTNYCKRMLWVIALLVSLSITGPVLGSDKIPAELTARWWQWATSIPSSVHPLSLKAADPTGADYCMVGQQGEDWFLGGVFKAVDVENPINMVGDYQVVERECVVPLGKTILVPVINGECSTAEEIAWGNLDPNAGLDEKISYLRYCAETMADAIDEHEAFFGPGRSNPLEVERIWTENPFSITFSPDNILANCTEGEEFLCQPDPNPSLAHADGYWARVKPPAPGKYRLQTKGKVTAYGFALIVNYTLHVVEPE